MLNPIMLVLISLDVFSRSMSEGRWKNYWSLSASERNKLIKEYSNKKDNAV